MSDFYVPPGALSMDPPPPLEALLPSRASSNPPFLIDPTPRSVFARTLSTKRFEN